jgi:hypothetical protein
MTIAKRLQVTSWLLGLIVTLAVFTVWSQVRLTGQVLTAYDLFPLLGLVAFSLMWTHYVTDALRRYLKQDRSVLEQYFKISSGVVLVLILLHPGIFLVKLWLDGLGLPPFSYFQVYGGIMQRAALVLGTLSLLVFLTYELYRWFRQAPWWKYVGYANILAMGAIFYHGLTLGDELSLTWFRVVWFFYGVTFVCAVIYNEMHKERRTA